MPALSSQPASRLALTAAIAEHHTVDVRGYPLGIDRATYDGRLRSDKAPGQPVVAVPVYVAGKALGAEPATVLRPDGNLGVWWVTFWTSFLPYVALVVLMFLVASRYVPTIPAFASAVGLGVGSMLLPHGVNLYGATLAALTAYGAWALIDAGPLTPGRLVAAGMLAGAGVAMEYETAIVLVAVAVVVFAQARGRGPLVRARCDGAGAAPRLVPDRGLRPAVAHRARLLRDGGDPRADRRLRDRVAGPRRDLRRFPQPVADQRHRARRTRGRDTPGTRAPPVVRRHAVLALGLAVPYLMLCTIWKGTPALEEPGPRYLIPLIPFLAVPLAVAWPRIRRVALVAMGVSGTVAVAAATTNLLTAKNQQVLPEMIRRVARGEFHPTVWSMGLGGIGVAVYVASVAGCGVALVGALRAPEPARSPDPRPAADEMR